MSALGHNETAVRLAALAGDAQIALDRVARGSSEAIEGWLAYGAALNEGRSLFPADREFGEWVSVSQLATPTRDERAAAMWAAANRDQFEEARAAGDARTVRGIHRQWKKIEADREKARREEEAKRKAEEERQARAEAAAAARKEAEAKKAEEEAARQAAAAANDAEERKAAQEKAEAAAEAARAAEAKAEAVEAGAAPEPEPDPEDPAAAAVRQELMKLTPEALMDEAIGLRLALDDEKAARRKAEAEVRSLKQTIKDFTGDEADTIRRLQAEVRRMERARWKAEEDLTAWKRKCFILEKRVKELEGMEITL